MKWSKTRAFGQHLLTDKNILKKIIISSQISKDEVVCEAGTGEGILTRELCNHAKRVISYEIDMVFYLQAMNSLSGLHNLLLVHSNVFKVSNIDFHVFVSNLPYSRSKDAIKWLALRKFKRAIVMLQKDFVDKLQARPGEKSYRSISVIGQYCFRIERLFEVSRTSFSPPPQVNSHVVRLIPYKENRMDAQTLNNLSYIFSQKNRKASSVARAFGSRLSCFHNSDNNRIGQLTPTDIISLSESLTKKRLV